MQEPYKPKWEYSIDEWMKHFDHFLRNGSKRDELMRYFGEQYGRDSISEGAWKMNRCGKALAYLMRHLDDFEQFVVKGERRALVQPPIARGLWCYYSGIPDEYLDAEPDPKEILKLAQEEAE